MLLYAATGILLTFQVILTPILRGEEPSNRYPNGSFQSDLLIPETPPLSKWAGHIDPSAEWHENVDIPYLPVQVEKNEPSLKVEKGGGHVCIGRPGSGAVINMNHYQVAAWEASRLGELQRLPCKNNRS